MVAKRKRNRADDIRNEAEKLEKGFLLTDQPIDIVAAWLRQNILRADDTQVQRRNQLDKPFEKRKNW